MIGSTNTDRRTLVYTIPNQQLPFSKKNINWRKQHLDWASGRTFFNYSLVRKSVLHKKINYDLLQGRLHMSDLEVILNPDNIQTQGNFIPNNIQHYPIINSKINILRGEESQRIFDYRVVITNPNSISEIEEMKKDQLLQDLQQIIESESKSDDEYKERIQKLSEYYSYDWQDFREIRANELLNHYKKELNLNELFNNGFVDACAVGEEIYQCDIIGGEPTVVRLNPLKLRIFKSAFSNKIEDADIIIYEDYVSPGKIIDTYYDSLTEKDIKYIEELPSQPEQGHYDSMGNIDERFSYVDAAMIGEDFPKELMLFDPYNENTGNLGNNLLPYDLLGNIRVVKMYWKSRRKIKKVKSYDPQTGEPTYDFYPETYIIDKNKGEEETIFYINEAWEGTKIGNEIYVNMRPRVVQYNRLSNPSRCHFGIIGTIYNINDSKPYSLIDIMKPYNYLYDVLHDRLNKAIAANWGKLLRLDLAKVPKGWEVEKWLYFARNSHIAVEDSFKEGNIGAATGKIAGGLSNNASGAIDLEVGNYIQNMMNILEYIKNEMSEVVGISKQREGQVSNRETVGGVERATIQSTYITEWLFNTHENLKKRVLECLLETAKIALRGGSKKFQYILSDNSLHVMDIDGDEFAECDYGLIVDSSKQSQELNQKLDMLAQAALQNQTLSFSAIMKLYNSSSLAEKQRMVEINENLMQQQKQQQQQAQLQQQQQIAQMQMDMKEKELQLKESQNVRDNQTQLIITKMNLDNDDRNFKASMQNDTKQATLEEKAREFNEKMELERQKLNLTGTKLEHDKQKHLDDLDLKSKQLSVKNK